MSNQILNQFVLMKLLYLQFEFWMFLFFILQFHLIVLSMCSIHIENKIVFVIKSNLVFFFLFSKWIWALEVLDWWYSTYSCNIWFDVDSKQIFFFVLLLLFHWNWQLFYVLIWKCCSKVIYCSMAYTYNNELLISTFQG